MADVTNSNAAAGDLAKTAGAIIISSNAGGTIAKGDAVYFDSSGDVIQSDTSATGDRSGGFGIALEAGTSGNNIRVLVGGYGYVVSGGTIVTNNLVKASGGTAGEVITNDYPSASAISSPPIDTEIESDVDIAVDFLGKTIGRYLGHQLQEDNPTDAADNDIIAISLTEGL